VLAPPLRSCTLLVEAGTTQADYLGLMHGALAGAARSAGSEPPVTEALGRLVTPCAPALRELLSRLRGRYAAVRHAALRGSLDRDVAAVDAQRARAALVIFEAEAASVFVDLLRSHRATGAPVVPSSVIVPFLSLCVLARGLAVNAEAIVRLAGEALDSLPELPDRMSDGLAKEEDETTWRGGQRACQACMDAGRVAGV